MKTAPVTLESLALDPRDRRDLAWYYSEDCRGDCGLRSSLGPQIDRLVLGYVDAVFWDGRDDEHRIMESMRRRRRIRERTEQLTRDEQGALYGVFASHRPAEADVEPGKRRYWSALLSLDLGRLAAALRLREPMEHKAAKAAAEALVLRAMRAYALTRDSRGCR